MARANPNLAIAERGLSRRPLDPDAVYEREAQLYGPDNKLVRRDPGPMPAFEGRTPAPGQPLMPYLPAGADPRTFFPRAGINLQYVPRNEFADLTPFQLLRNLKDTSDLVSLCVEDVINQVLGLEWDVVPDDPKERRSGGMKPEIDAARKFLDSPDREHDFAGWLSGLMEDALVIDALCFYRHRTISGEPYALKRIDGATIKPLLDIYGGIPAPPNPAYQQYGHGRIETEFTRPHLPDEDPGTSGQLVELVYRPMKVRNWHPYGQSPTERVLLTVNLALRRQIHYLDFYTDGNIPDAFWRCPEEWKADDIKQAQAAFEALLAGESGYRRRLRFMPGGNNVGLELARGHDEWKREFDEQLARLVCYAFRTSPLPLVQLMNRATSEQAEIAEGESSQHPMMKFLARIVCREIKEFLGHQRVKFIWTEDKHADEAAWTGKAVAFVGRGIYSVNDVLEEEGREPVDGGDVRLVDTPSGPMPLSEVAMGIAAEEPGGAPASPGTALGVPLPPAGAGGNGGAEAKPSGIVPPPKELSPIPTPFAEAEDLRRWRKVAAKCVQGGRKQRPFSSGTIQPALKRAIEEWLDHARSQEDVDWCFRRLVKAPRPLVAARRRIRLERAMRRVAKDHFDRVAPSVAQVVLRSYAVKIAKLEGGPSDGEVDDAMKWEAFFEEIQEPIADAFREAEVLAADKSGIEIAFGITDEQAQKYAKERGAELVGMKVLEDGSVVPNPSAKWSVKQTVRDQLRGTIDQALSEGWTERRLQEAIEGGPIWDVRSDAIARTEVGFALNIGTAQTYRAAGVEEVDIFDGPGCLKDGHDDQVTGVDGERWLLEEFEQNPLGHTNCTRTANPVLPEAE